MTAGATVAMTQIGQPVVVPATFRLQDPTHRCRETLKMTLIRWANSLTELR
jgi:hypothetical protein